MVAFMDNHCMLQLFARPQWKTVQGRSHVYVDKIAALLNQDKERLRLSTGVKRVAVKAGGGSGGVEVTDTAYRTEVYDDVVFACHPDQALAVLGEEGGARVGGGGMVEEGGRIQLCVCV